MFNSYRHSTQEAQTRKLADFALMIADYRLAAATYELARKDFLNDKAWRYYASATVGFCSCVCNGTLNPEPYFQRMTGLLNLLLRKVPGGPLAIPEGDQYLEQAANSPIAGTAQLDGLRAIALYYELYQEQEDWQTAALSLAKFASDVSCRCSVHAAQPKFADIHSQMDELPSALMIEQAAMAMLRLQRPARRRFSLLMTIAAHRYQKTGHVSIATLLAHSSS